MRDDTEGYCLGTMKIAMELRETILRYLLVASEEEWAQLTYNEEIHEIYSGHWFGTK